jgi:UTP--glucose-1-phosphate uridylyltransferase
MSVIKKCLFPAAGYDTRFLPATKAMPKEMLPIVTKSLIQYGVEEAMDAGITEIGVVTGRGKRAIEDHFDISCELEQEIAGSDKEELLNSTRDIMDRCTFSYTRQAEMKGLGHAILVGEALIGREPFAVVLADDYCVTEGDGVLTQMVKLYEKYQCSIVAIEEVPVDESHKYGVIAGELEADGVYRVHNMVEKPAPKDARVILRLSGAIFSVQIYSMLSVVHRQGKMERCKSQMRSRFRLSRAKS